MQPATLGSRPLGDEAVLLRSDEELPCLFSEDLAKGCIQVDFARTSSAAGRTQDFPTSWRKFQGCFQEKALWGSTEDAISARPESQQYRYPIRGQVAVTPTPSSHQQPGCTIAQIRTSSATPFHETKAENGEPTPTCTPLRMLSPLPATSPFILKSQPESSKAWEPFPAYSPLILKSQPESSEALKPFPTNSPVILRSQPAEMENKLHSPFVQKFQREETMAPAKPLEKDRCSRGRRGAPSTASSSWQGLDADGRAICRTQGLTRKG